MNIRKASVMAVFLVLLLVPATADLGSKPKMEFNVVYNISDDISLEGGEQLQCESISCENATPLENYGPQGFRCGEEECSSLAYGYSEFNKLKLNFSDETRESNVFTTGHHDAKFKVFVRESSLRVKERTPLTATQSFQTFLTTVFLTFLIEIPVAAIFLGIVGFSKRVLGLVSVANIFSLTVFWILFNPLSNLIPILYTILILEVFAVSSEFAIIDYLKKGSVTRRQTILLSLIMNLSSFIIGGPLLLIFTTF